jgi:hypothetical protein
VLDLSGRSYVTVQGLLARGGWFNLQNCTSCTVKDCHLRAPNWIRTVDGYSVWPQYMGGIDVSGAGNLIEGGSVRLAGRSCVHVAGTGNTVRQMTLEDCGLNWANEAGIMLNESDQSLIERNTVRRTAMAGIAMGPRSRVLSNLVENVCLFAEDYGRQGRGGCLQHPPRKPHALGRRHLPGCGEPELLSARQPGGRDSVERRQHHRYRHHRK